MRSELMLAINQLCAERKLSPDVVMEALEASLISAYKRNFGSATNIEVNIDADTGEVRVYAAKEVVDAVTDKKSQVSLDEAHQHDPDLGVGETVLIESTPRDFGRIAAQTAKQVILQRIREAERDALFSTFADSAGEIAHGTIQSVDYHSGDVIVNIEGAEALLPSREQVPAERYRRGSRIRAYVVDVRRGNRGPQITLSRRSPALLRRLLELEVPEIFNGSVEIKGIAREAGSRSKVAVHATQDGVDPVGSCVGVRGGRIQNVVNELGGEKIDVVQWSTEIGSFIANSLSPAKVMNVLLDDAFETGKTATVIVPDRQLSLAIGKEGQNARLSAKLTGWRIDIKSATEAAEETMGRFEDATLPPEEMDLLSLAEAILRDEKREKTEQAAKIGEEPFSVEGEIEDEVEAAEVEPAGAELSEPEAASKSEMVAEPVEQQDLVQLEPEDLEMVAEGTESDAERDEVEDMEPAGGRFLPEWEETTPTFEGEPILDSLGWIRTDTEEDLYTGWAEVEEEQEEPEDEDLWERDEIEEDLGPAKDGKKKKRKKDRWDYDDDYDLDEWMGRGGTRSRQW